jgi:hypothetical protein
VSFVLALGHHGPVHFHRDPPAGEIERGNEAGNRLRVGQLMAFAIEPNFHTHYFTTEVKLVTNSNFRLLLLRWCIYRHFQAHDRPFFALILPDFA